MIRRNRTTKTSGQTPAEIFLEQNSAALQAVEAQWQEVQERLLVDWERMALEMNRILQDALTDQIQKLFGKLTEGMGGFAGEWANLFGQQLGANLGSLLPSPLSIVNVIDPSFVHSAIAENPQTVINVINDDIMRNGSTRRTIQSHT